MKRIRIQQLEEKLLPKGISMTDTDMEFAQGLSVSTYMRVIDTFARILAERRYLHEVGAPAGGLSGHCGDWKAFVSEQDRADRVEAEWQRLTVLTEQEPGHAIEHWTALATEECWPSLRGVTFALNATGFEALWSKQRQSLDKSRGCDMPGARWWRRRNPGWFPGMPPAEALAFEVELLRSMSMEASGR